jgi:DNA-directed RNA polymerase specialized sigma24 family protein
MEVPGDQDELIRKALDALAAENGSGMLDLLDAFGPSLRAAFFQSDVLRGRMEVDDFIYDVILALGKAWKAKRDPIDNAEAWCITVLKRRGIDVVRKDAGDPLGRRRKRPAASQESAGSGPAEVDDYGALAGDEDPERAAFLAQLCLILSGACQSLPEDVRMVLYLAYVRGFKLPQVARLMAEAKRVQIDESSTVAQRAAETEEYRIARGMGVGVREAAYLALDPHEQQKLRDAAQLQELDAEAAAKARNRAQNRCRSGRFQLYHKLGALLPKHPPELRQCWRACLPNEADGFVCFAEAAARLGIPPERAREYEEEVQDLVRDLTMPAAASWQRA